MTTILTKGLKDMVSHEQRDGAAESTGSMGGALTQFMVPEQMAKQREMGLGLRPDYNP